MRPTEDLECFLFEVRRQKELYYSLSYDFFLSKVTFLDMQGNY